MAIEVPMSEKIRMPSDVSEGCTCVQNINKSKQEFQVRRTEAVVAERLRRLTRNQIPSGSVGSNPTDCETTFLLHQFGLHFIMNFLCSIC